MSQIRLGRSADADNAFVHIAQNKQNLTHFLGHCIFESISLS